MLLGTVKLWSIGHGQPIEDSSDEENESVECLLSFSPLKKQPITSVDIIPMPSTTKKESKVDLNPSLLLSFLVAIGSEEGQVLFYHLYKTESTFVMDEIYQLPTHSQPSNAVTKLSFLTFRCEHYHHNDSIHNEEEGDIVTTYLAIGSKDHSIRILNVHGEHFSH